jgi:hypothetical protein
MQRHTVGILIGASLGFVGGERTIRIWRGYETISCICLVGHLPSSHISFPCWFSINVCSQVSNRQVREIESFAVI